MICAVSEAIGNSRLQAGGKIMKRCLAQPRQAGPDGWHKAVLSPEKEK